MSALTQVSEHCFYLPGPTQPGLVITAPGEACLIDSGGDKSTARLLRRELDSRALRLTAILNTHTHADHTGGNHHLQSTTGCRIYAPAAELAFTATPILEPALLYGGYPPPALLNKFLLARPCAAEPLSPQALPPGLESIPLPGHSPGMVGFRSAEGITYLADALAAPATLRKYRIFYLYDVAAHLRTLDSLQRLQAALFIPAHAEPTADLSDLLRTNIDHVHSMAESILTHCRTAPCTADDLLAHLLTQWQLPMNPTQHALAGSTIRSYLSYLSDLGRLTPFCDSGRLLWGV